MSMVSEPVGLLPPTAGLMVWTAVVVLLVTLPMAFGVLLWRRSRARPTRGERHQR